jgi:hypothetical protein
MLDMSEIYELYRMAVRPRYDRCYKKLLWIWKKV